MAGDQIGYNGSNGGWALAGGQDLNGDGKSDILIGATVDAGSRPAWVVFGKPSSSPVDLATLAADGSGYEIDPPAGQTFGSYGTGAGIDLALVADLNGDGRGEAVLGVPGAGTTYVAFGKASTSPLNLASLGSGGWTITGSFAQTAGSTCDFNGDGRPDVLVGDQSGSLGRNSNGRTWVIYGHATGNVDLTALTASEGIRLDGATSFEYASESALTGVGDVNGSGRCGIVIGAYQYNNVDGKAYVVYGRPTGATEFDLAGLTGADGYVVTDAGQYASLGHGGDAAGDFNGDGRPDVITDAPFAPDFLHPVGEADLIYGFGAPTLRYGSINATAGSEITPLVPAVQQTGAASFSISPALPAGLSFDPSTGAISGTPAAAQPATSYTVTMTDLAGAASTTISLAVAPPPRPDRQQADSIQVQKIEQQISLGPGQTVTVTQDCPAAAPIATDGSVRIDHVDQGTGYLTSVDVLESRAVAAGRWVARVHNLASGDAQAKLFVVCVANRTTPDSHALRFSGRLTTTVTWGIGSHQALLSCPAGRIPVAPGFDFVSGSGWWYRSVQSGSSWLFGAHVTSPAAVELSIRCLARGVGVAQRHSHRLLFGFPVRAPGLAALSGTSAYVLSCGDHAKAIVGGFDLGPGIRTFGNDPQPKSRVFQLANLGLPSSTAHLTAICLEVRTSGRVGG